MNVCVYGLSVHHLESFFADESTRRSQPFLAASAADLRFGLVAGARCFGSWGRGWPVALERCSCRQKPCALLSPCHPSEQLQPYQSTDDSLADEHYVAQVDVAAEDVAHFRSCSSTTGAAEGTNGECRSFVLPCRLVIVENAFFRASMTADFPICATSGTVIAGVDQQHSLPSSLTVIAVAPGWANDTGLESSRVRWCGALDVRPAATRDVVGAGLSASPFFAAAGSSQVKVGVNMEGEEEGAEAKPKSAAASAVHFTATGDQFGFLHNLPALPPRPRAVALERAPASAAAPPVFPLTLSETADRPHMTTISTVVDIPPFCNCGQDVCDGATNGEPGPLLALSFYANDPRLPYDQAAWETGLTEGVQEIVRYRKREGKEPAPITTMFSVTDVRPVPVEGSCWCQSSLPMPAPLEQQLREAKKKQGINTPLTSQWTNISSLSRVSSETSLSTPNMIHHHSHRESPRKAMRSTTAPAAAAGFLEKGWCVRPLRSAKPVLSDMGNMDDHGRPPLNSNRTHEMWTCLLNLRELEEFGIEVTIKVPYVVEGNVLQLKGTTVIFSGMLQSSTSGTLLLPVFCPAPEGTPNTELASLWVRLYVQYLLVFPFTEGGTRGPLEVVRSRETHARLTVPTLIGHRGLGKTYTRSPVIGDAAADPLVMKCNENTVAAFQAAHARGCAMIEFDVMLSADRVPVVIHDPVIELLALKRDGAYTSHDEFEHAPVRAEVHKLNVTQLRDLHAQGCKTLGRVFPLKDLLAHHWGGLVRWATAQRSGLIGGGDAAVVAAGAAERRQRHYVVDSSLMRGEDFPDGVPTLRQVLEHTPPSLRFNLEVKYPFQPRWDSNLFLQSDAFEVNGFVDAILRLVFEFAEDGREITFSSFDPNICLALSLKQSRYDVFFLSDTKELRDLKDYRSFYIEGAIQFANAQHLAGISMNAATLLSAEDEAALARIPESPIYGVAERGPVLADFFRSEVNPTYDVASVPSFFGSYGRAMVAEMHRRNLKVWTWGGTNSHLYFAYAQAAKMRVDGVIGDRIPVFSS
jgi:glycerophosphoryl diester phosphodiesterase